MTDEHNLAPETITVEGAEVYVEHTSQRWSNRPYATVTVKEADARRLSRLPELRGHAYLDRVYVRGEDGGVVSGFNLRSVQHQLARLDEEARKDAIFQEKQARITELMQDCDRIRSAGLPVYRLESLLGTAASALRWLFDCYDPTLEQCNSTIRAAEREIERLSGNPTDVLVAMLLEGDHSVSARNKWVRQRVEALAIRSGGFVEPITGEMLETHYRDALQGARTVVDIVIRQDRLLLRLEDYAPRAIVQELDLAPEHIRLTGRKTAASYPVAYRSETVDGAETPFGVVQVPLSVYERNAAEPGKRSGFPTLPYGITLLIEVTLDDKLVARGVDGEGLRGKIKKAKGAKSRSGNAPLTDELGLPRHHAVLAEQPPPWHQGRRTR